MYTSLYICLPDSTCRLWLARQVCFDCLSNCFQFKFDKACVVIAYRSAALQLCVGCEVLGNLHTNDQFMQNFIGDLWADMILIYVSGRVH